MGWSGGHGPALMTLSIRLPGKRQKPDDFYILWKILAFPCGHHATAGEGGAIVILIVLVVLVAAPVIVIVEIVILLSVAAAAGAVVVVVGHTYSGTWYKFSLSCILKCIFS